MAQLTERQQEIQDRLREGKKPPQIADELGITTNAVYQQLRRMRNSGNRPATGGRGRGNAGRSSARSPQRRPAPAPAAQPQVVTPLQAIRARRDEIQGSVKEAKAAVVAAEKALARAQADHDKIDARHSDELAHLDAAEVALGHGKPRAQRKPRSKGRSTRSRGRSQARSRSNGRKAAAGGRGGRGAQASSQGGNGGSPEGQPAAATA